MLRLVWITKLIRLNISNMLRFFFVIPSADYCPECLKLGM